MRVNHTKLELEKVLQSDVDEIFESRKKANLIHNTSDIVSSGAEIEKTVRNVLSRKLPKSYYLGHGHIVDKNLVTSSQLDIIIADNNNVPILFKSKNGTEYFPFESVHAIGEIKSTYYSSKKDVSKFIQVIKSIKTNLNRQKTPKNYLGNEISLGSGFSVNIKNPYRNPLFSFMIFVNSGDFKIDHLLESYKENENKNLPNIILFLDKGCLVNAEFIKRNSEYDLASINLIPEFVTSEQKINSEWIFLSFGDKTNSTGNNFGFFYFFLYEHLVQSVLINTNLQKYLSQFFTIEGAYSLKDIDKISFRNYNKTSNKRKCLKINVKNL